MKKYDIAFSMGFSCGGTMALRRAGLQYASYPLDWVGSPGIVQSARMIASDFEGWFEKDDLRLVDVRTGSLQNNVYQNVRTRFGFPHDFSRFFRFDDLYAEERAKYDRRIARFKTDLSSAKTALAVYADRPIFGRAPDDNLREALCVLREKYPGVAFDLLYFFQKDGCGDFAETQVDNCIAVVACDYKQMMFGEVSHAIRPEVISKYLVGRFEVQDRRTETEKAAYARMCKEKRRKKFGSRLDELKYRLYRRLEKELQEKGRIPHDFPLWFD